MRKITYIRQSKDFVQLGLKNMKLMMLMISLVILTACGSGTETTQYYQLPNSSQSHIQKPTAATKIVWVDTVQLAQQLSSVNVAFQTTDVNYTLAQNHHWASPLDQQLQFALVDELSRQLPNTWVTTAPQSQNAARVSVTITQFHPRYDGKVILSGRFSLSQGSNIIAQPFELIAPQSKAGYDESIRQLALLWQQQSVAIAQLLQD
ncbi:ABC-type transport auxiliary lipoprotein family protein [Thorsellia anophelis]|uniref:ABC-type transport auxiliary lipoprotein component domain-containing protein n=1 Tax=Thorsellia anophelis DSM 18579 TaxID=1123402 RepID=A0A1I0AMP4_9GAMM|nr:ABC-type transport auxiliary lipoprotein family protein [Thorsellia anophelis]SES95591.1 hypothetical protein SAMN02583745_00983 [Thorsellia anophelis DSM 18579]